MKWKHTRLRSPWVDMEKSLLSCRRSRRILYYTIFCFFCFFFLSTDNISDMLHPILTLSHYIYHMLRSPWVDMEKSLFVCFDLVIVYALFLVFVWGISFPRPGSVIVDGHLYCHQWLRQIDKCSLGVSSFPYWRHLLSKIYTNKWFLIMTIPRSAEKGNVLLKNNTLGRD